MTDTPVDQDVVDILTTDHHEVLDLLQQIKTSTDAEERRDLADTVISELVRHSVAEEMYVYPAMKKYLPDGDEAVDHDVEEHTELERAMKKLESVDARGPASAPGTWTRWSAAGSTTWSTCATRPARPALTFRLGLPGVDRCAKRLL